MMCFAHLEQMHTSMLTAVVVCVLAQGSAAHKRAGEEKKIKYKLFFFFSFSLSPIMRTMIQPSHRTFCSPKFSSYALVRPEQKGRKKNKSAISHPCACDAHYERNENSEKKEEEEEDEQHSPRCVFFSFSFSFSFSSICTAVVCA